MQKRKIEKNDDYQQIRAFKSMLANE